MDISRKEPGVMHLPIHLPGQNRSQFFRADDSQSSMSLLLRYFRRPEALAVLKYTDYFEQYSLTQDDGTPLDSGEYRETPHGQYSSLLCSFVPGKRKQNPGLIPLDLEPVNCSICGLY